jgi:maltose alpha-D-glucosyltransferase/alpha-amylase
VWRDEPPEDWEPQIIFPGQQTTNWTFDEEAGQYYLHHFYPHQPDLNLHEPAVRDELAEIVAFWTQQGLAGFRVDAVPFLVEFRSAEAEELLTPHELLRDLRDFLGRRRGDGILLGEVNLPPIEQAAYFGSGDQLHLMFNFFLNQHIYLALARNDPDPIRKAMRALPDTPSVGQWANFLKNHDEQTLDQLTRSEREEVFAAFGPKPEMQLFGRGLRRRLPSMLAGDQARLRLAYSLLFSLPGTPVLLYGEEIGMGENLEVEGRSSVRTPMQWQAGPNGGFSTAPADKLRRPLGDGKFGAKRVNVAVQRHDPDSLLNWMERLIRRRRETAEFGLGVPRVIDVEDQKVFAHSCDLEGRMVLALHNFGANPTTVDIRPELGEAVVDLIDLWGDRQYRPPRPAAIELDGHGYRWIRIRRQGHELLL